MRSRVVTSRDDAASELRRALTVDNVPEGFRKYQLPVYTAAGQPDVRNHRRA